MRSEISSEVRGKNTDVAVDKLREYLATHYSYTNEDGADSVINERDAASVVALFPELSVAVVSEEIRKNNQWNEETRDNKVQNREIFLKTLDGEIKTYEDAVRMFPSLHAEEILDSFACGQSGILERKIKDGSIMTTEQCEKEFQWLLINSPVRYGQALLYLSQK